MRYLVEFTRDADIKFVSRLGLMRTIQRIVRKAELPVGYSKGSNPHMTLAVTQPLSVGVYSEGDYLDLNLTKNMNEQAIKERLDEFSANGIRFLEVLESPVIHDVRRLPVAMTLLDTANYTTKIRYNDVSKAEEEVNALVAKREIITIKRTKEGEKGTDIKPFIKDSKCWTKDNCLIINTTIGCESRENLSAGLLADVIKENTSNVNGEAFVEIERVEMYTYKGGTLAPLYKYI